jgi:hypothetical protein
MVREIIPESRATSPGIRRVIFGRQGGRAPGRILARICEVVSRSVVALVATNCACITR